MSAGACVIPLSVWERAGVRVPYERKRSCSYATLTRAARGFIHSQRERRIDWKVHAASGLVVDAGRVALLVGQLQLAFLVDPEQGCPDRLVVLPGELDRHRGEPLGVDVQVVQ